MAPYVCTIPSGVDCEVGNKVIGVSYNAENSRLVLHLEPEPLALGRGTAVYFPVDKAVADKLAGALG